MSKKNKIDVNNVVFADVYLGCRTLGNIMGLHEETVRKRAVKGLIPGTKTDRGWSFAHSTLALAGIEPFRSNSVPNVGIFNAPVVPAVAPKPPLQLLKRKTSVVFVLDGSGSMSHLRRSVKEYITNQVNQLALASTAFDQYDASVINFDDKVDLGGLPVPICAGNINKISELYRLGGGCTALNDAIVESVKLCERLDDGSQAFLIVIVTDGQENASNTGKPATAEVISRLNKTDRATITFAGPSSVLGYAHSLGIDQGNVTSWDATVEGLQTFSRESVCSMNSYTTARSAGTMRSTSFYAQPVVADAANFASKLDAEVPQITSAVTAYRVSVGDPTKISEFCVRKVGRFTRGEVYYQLTESEKVQDYKKVIIQDTDTGRFYSGWRAAALIGIPTFTGTVRIRPGTLGKFKIFIQSTSTNRKLTVGSVVLTYAGQ